MRGFKEVSKEYKKNFNIYTDENGKELRLPKEVQLPVRGDKGSAGYDFYAPKSKVVLPGHSELIWTDIKSYMEEDEVLKIHIRSSMAINHGLKITNVVGIIDSSYYENEDNDGNIGISIENTSGKSYTINEGDRIAQGIFSKYLTVSNEEEVLKEERKGGIGSTKD